MVGERFEAANVYDFRIRQPDTINPQTERNQEPSRVVKRLSPEKKATKKQIIVLTRIEAALDEPAGPF